MQNDAAIQAMFTRPPVVLSIAKDPGGEARLMFDARPGVSYTMEYRDDLNSGSWQPLADLPPGPTTGVVTNTDPASRTERRRCYRIVAAED